MQREVAGGVTLVQTLAVSAGLQKRLSNSLAASTGAAASPPRASASPYAEDGIAEEALLRRADEALYSAKAVGRGCYRVAGAS